MIRLITFLLAVTIFSAEAQELNCTVKINAENARQTDQKTFQTLERNLTDFINNRKWTNEVFSNNERIECSFTINIAKEVATDLFQATVVIQSSRPVYNSSYNTVTFMHQDKDFIFEYSPFQPLDYNENTFTSDLTSFVAFYVNIILGMDYDSFSQKGGTNYFEKAQQIVTNAQGGGSPGWKAGDGIRNRFWLASNLNDRKFEVFRNVFYRYHRAGMDKMYDEAIAARKVVMESLESLQTISRENPNALLLSVFFNSKSRELVDIFSMAIPNEKSRAVELLSNMDPSRTQEYQKIQQR